MYRQVVSVLLFAMAAPVASQADSVVLVVVDNRGDKQWNETHLRLFAEYGVKDRLEESGQLRGFTSVPYGEINGDFARQIGYVTTVSPAGQISSTHFNTVKDRTVFDSIVKQHTDRILATLPRGTETSKSEEDGILTVTIAGHTDTAGRRSPAWSLHFRYHQTVLVSCAGPDGKSGRDQLAKLPIAQIAKLIRPARGKMRYAKYLPGNVAKRHRLQVLGKVTNYATVKLQRMDNESKSTHAARVSSADAYLKLLESLLLDVEDATLVEEWPRGRDPYRFRIQVRPKAETQLQQLIIGLNRRRTPVSLAKRQGVIGSATLNLAVPKALQPLVQSRLASLSSPDSLLSKILEQLAVEQRATVSADVCLVDDANGHPTALGMLQLSKALSGQRSKQAFDLAGGKGPANYSLVVATDSDRLRVFAGPAGSSLSVGDAEADMDKGERAASVIDIRGNFQPYLQRDEAAGEEFLNWLESSYVRGVLGRSYAATSDFESIRKMANPDGDWTLKARLRAGSSGLNFDFSLGRDLHALYLMRNQLR